MLVGDRVVIPPSLQSEVLEVLHSAHQGTTGMTNRAVSSIYWPGMLADISRKRAALLQLRQVSPQPAICSPHTTLTPSLPIRANLLRLLLTLWQEIPDSG